MRLCLIVTLTLCIAMVRAQALATAAANDGSRVNGDKRILKELNTAWHLSADGTNGHEAVVLIFRGDDGLYTARLQGFSNQYQRASFNWNPAALAIVHTHPNKSDPRPTAQDRRIADKYHVPNFTITISGMYVYDPATKKTSKVLNGLGWLDAVNLSSWIQEIAHRPDKSVLWSWHLEIMRRIKEASEQMRKEKLR